MWRRVYLFLVLVRLYFALSPSYLHPDENFQGPEVIAGESIVFLEAQFASISLEGFSSIGLEVGPLDAQCMHT
jgi:hypothetical protein